MNICLADVRTRSGAVNKDLAGGFGTASAFGTSLLMRGAARLKRGMVDLPIMSLGYLSAILASRGAEVTASRGALPPGADVCLVHASLVEHEAELAFADEARRAGARVGFVGPLATERPETFLAHGDFVVAGEPEQAAGTVDLATARGVVRSDRVADLDSLPFPDWSPFDHARFSYGIYLRRGPVFPVLSSRGCPLGCGYYCPYPSTQGKALRTRSPEAVVAEVGWLRRRFGAAGVVFRDPLFTLDRDRAARIAELLVDAGHGLPWACETHPAFLDRELLALMHRAGLRGISFGVESASPEVLRGGRRAGCSPEALAGLVASCRALGIRTGAFYVIGQLEDTRERIEATMALSRALDTDYAQFTIATPYPGTPFFGDLEPRLLGRSWRHFDAYTPVFRHPTLTADELLRLKERAMAGYYLRPAWLLRFLGPRGLAWSS